MRADRRRRAWAVAAALAGAGYLAWTVRAVNPAAYPLALPLAAAHAFFVAQLWLAAANHWHRSRPTPPAPLPAGGEPTVAVVVPTCGEPVAMLAATLRSVLDQDWPAGRLIVVVGDDARRAAVQQLVGDLAGRYPRAALHYLRPPPRTDPARRGRGKAGNLNAALDLLDAVAPHVPYVEFRDADDLVGDPQFLRRVVAHLAARADLAYVQTVKDATVSPGDPFGNRHALFYRGVLYSRDAAGAVPPCGSGLVWRRADLRAIGGLPTWSLVEDVYSGYVAWRAGRRGGYLPVCGAV
ncbi:MAG TPA: glycosyltransferase, partial [Pilimelia sp.]|nr:glycosyltransferase [Pilimelia sp.]